jgi:glycosyltransferase involved in cell wall biosynthesis
MDTSVIVPTRNRGTMLGTALRCVLGQRDVQLEVIVVDDASTDDTSEVLRTVDDTRVRVVRNAEPVGPNAARNRGAEGARGRWVAFIDDDDLWAPTKLAAQLAAAEGDSRDWAYAGSVNVNDRLEIIHGIPPPSPAEVVASVRRSNPIPASASNVVIRRSSFEAAGGFNEELRACEEWDLWIRLADEGPPAWVPEPLVSYRMHPGNAILDVEALVAGARRLEQLHGTGIDWGHFHRWLAQLCVRGGRRREALGQYARAAIRGNGRDVVADLARLARGRFRRPAGGPGGTGDTRPDPAWEDRARAWLEVVRRHEVDPEGGSA